jgi:hypothetical protein
MFRWNNLQRLKAALVLLSGSFFTPTAQAQQDVAHAVTGIIKHVDHGAKLVVVKTADGTEHTIKYTDRTTVRAGKDIKHDGADAWLGTKEGSKVTVRYTSRAGEDTAIGVKDAAEKTADALKN